MPFYTLHECPLFPIAVTQTGWIPWFRTSAFGHQRSVRLRRFFGSCQLHQTSAGSLLWQVMFVTACHSTGTAALDTPASDVPECTTQIICHSSVDMTRLPQALLSHQSAVLTVADQTFPDTVFNQKQPGLRIEESVRRTYGNTVLGFGKRAICFLCVHLRANRVVSFRNLHPAVVQRCGCFGSVAALHVYSS